MSEKRKTLSLKLNVENKTKRSNGFEVEVRRKHRRGLVIDSDKKRSSLSVNNHKKLTDQEFKTRVKVLQEAMKQELDKQEEINKIGHETKISNSSSQTNNLQTDNIRTNNVRTDNIKDNSISADNVKVSDSRVTDSSKPDILNLQSDKSNDQQVSKYRHDKSKSDNSQNVSKIPSKSVIFRASEFNKSLNKTSFDKIDNKNDRSKFDKPNRSNRSDRSNGSGLDKLRPDRSRSNRSRPDRSKPDGFSRSGDSVSKVNNSRNNISRDNVSRNNASRDSNSRVNISKDNISRERTIARTSSDASITNINIPSPNKQNTKTNFKPKSKKIEDKKLKFAEKHSSNRIDRAYVEKALNDDNTERSRSLASIKRNRLKQRNKTNNEVAMVVREVLIPDTIAIGELANRMAVRASEIVKYLMSVGTIATINQFIDGEIAEIVCTSFGHIAKRVSEDDFENDLNFDAIDSTAELSPRAPIVAVMGHVDHGKTTLLDTLRKTAIAQREAGGITQHVAAYQIESQSGKKITFIDTPGHAAFSKIRARGANLTDIIVLVVAADDGVKEQTIEVIKQAKTQDVPIIVAINKIDKPDVNINKIKNELMNYDILLEEFGGNVLSTEISAKQNINLDKLIDTILLQAEMLDLKANNNRVANGTILEAKIEKGRGIVASVIVQGGTLKNGDIFVAGTTFGKVRALYNTINSKLAQALPATPVEIIGFDSAPEPGDTIVVVENEQIAREIAERRKNIKKSRKNATIKSINQMLDQDNIKRLKLYLKADVYGSLEAIEASLNLIQHPEIMVNIIGKDIGVISESDIDFANSSDAIVIGFNVNTTASAKEIAKLNGIKILNHNIIYHLTEEIKQIMSDMLPPIVEEQYTGSAIVKRLFVISRLGTIAGCGVLDGVIKRNNSTIKVTRNNKCIFEGKIKSMKHEKDEIKESKQNHECGILADGFNDFCEGDKIECYETIYKKRTID